ncbi:AAA family ATPase [Streptomyces sp. NBC_00525]|uniref:AAA family ATPase n=1 Tax=Streptomyces sp. NBC_00525 TaxID=2903660 RepID=UPI002E81FF0A|nr:ATP-binding protein [Streptomyces sp. NBC_00525]WUC94380.1 ATP-binding protein [Streptomyces sp. NBC_00525]
MQIDNIRGFSGEKKVNLDFQRPGGKYSGWTVIAGRNGSGKTSLLQCIALMLAGPAAAQTLAPNHVAWGSKPREQNSGSISASFFLDADDLKNISLEGVPEKPGVHGRASLLLPPPKIVSRSGKVVRLSFSSDWVQEVQSADDGDLEGEIFPTKNWFAAGYGPFRRLSSDIPEALTGPADLHDPSDAVSTAERFSTLFHEDAALGESVAWLVGVYLRSLEKERGAARLLKSVLELLSDGLLPDGYEAVKVTSSGLWVRSAGQTFPLREMSDGYRTVTALVLDIVRRLHEFYGILRARRGKGGIALHVPGVVMIDEIDAHMHVSWQQRIGGWLTTHFPKIQFIVTTHSPYVCQSADPGGLIRLPGFGEDVAPHVVDEQLHRRIVYGSGDDAALSALFGLDTPYSSEAERLRKRLVELEGKVFSGSASKAEVANYKRLSETLSSSLEARVDEVSGRLGRRS